MTRHTGMAILRDAGVSKLYSVTTSLPDGHPTEDTPFDTMHVFLCGITRHEGFWVLDDLIDVAHAITWEDVNESRKAINESLPQSHAIPYLERPTTDGKKKSAVTLCLNGAEVMHFAINRCAAPLERPPHRTPRDCPIVTRCACWSQYRDD